MRVYYAPILKGELNMHTLVRLYAIQIKKQAFSKPLHLICRDNRLNLAKINRLYRA
jgi:hypothetical protein